MRLEVVPAILAKSEREFKEKLTRIEGTAKFVHVDVMDGQFVPNKTWADPPVVGRWRTPAVFEVHLMVEEPFREAILWGKLEKVRRIIVHTESTRKLRELLHTIRTTGKEVGLAINPSTPLKRIKSFVIGVRLPRTRSARARNDEKGVDFVLVMSNEPGFSGKAFRPPTLRRIAALRKRFPKLPIGVDIGVNLETASLLRRAGATHIAAASAVFEAPDPIAAYRRLVRTFTSKK